MKTLKLLLFVFLFTLNSFASVFEIVQSVPVETNLEVSGIKHAKDVWLQMISEAQKSIDLEMFYASDDSNTTQNPILTNVTNEIIKAAKRGVKIRLLVDSKMVKTNQAIPSQLASIQNIQVKTIDFDVLTGGVQHAKFFIIDNKIFFMGSHNYDWRALMHIHEVGLKSDDANILVGLNKIFLMDWSKGVFFNQNPTNEIIQEKPLHEVASKENGSVFLASPPTFIPEGTVTTWSQYIKQITSAKKSIYLQTYDYGIRLFGKPGEWLELQNALIAASKRGVDVRLLVDKKSMTSGAQALTNLQNAGVTVKVVTIPDWTGGKIPYARLIHSKYILFDGAVAWMGSENLSGSYFLSTRNVGAIFTNTQAVSNLNDIFSKVWNSTYSKALTQF